MPKTIFIGDIHGSSLWKLITHLENADRVIFIGDYFDSFEFSTAEQIHNFKQIIEYKKSSKSEVILLIGNHDYHYLPNIDHDKTSGFQKIGQIDIRIIIKDNISHLQAAYQFDNILCSHAGVSSEFMDNTFGVNGWNSNNIVELLNNEMRYNPRSFQFINGGDKSGYNTYQTPICIRPQSLMKANRDTLRKEVIQIVGHTAQNIIDIKGKTTGGRYYFIDTINTSGQYLIHENGVFKLGKT